MRVHYTYKITFPEKGLYYFGKHSTKNIRDGYRGSGRVVQELIRRGDAYEVELIALHETCAAALKHEELLIRDRYRFDPNCVNRIKGGGGIKNDVGTPGNRTPRKDKLKVLMAARLGTEARRGQKDSPETKAQRNASVSLATMGVPKTWLRKRLQIDDKIFIGIDAAATEFGLNRYGVRVRLKSDKYPTWKEIEK